MKLELTAGMITEEKVGSEASATTASDHRSPELPLPSSFTPPF